jgi:hypothetical protein
VQKGAKKVEKQNKEMSLRSERSRYEAKRYLTTSLMAFSSQGLGSSV